MHGFPLHRNGRAALSALEGQGLRKWEKATKWLLCVPTTPHTLSSASQSQKEAVLKPQIYLGTQKHRGPIPQVLFRAVGDNSFAGDPETIWATREKKSCVPELQYGREAAYVCVCVCVCVCEKQEGPEKFYLNKFKSWPDYISNQKWLSFVGFSRLLFSTTRQKSACED